MDVKGFQVWLSAARGLTRAQRREALAVLSGRSEGEASKAAIELGVDEARRCPHCASEGAVSRGMARGLRRYQCKGCGRTFNALSGTPLSGLHHKERWLSFGASLAKGETVKASAARCDVAVSTAFRWRHRFLAAARSDSEVLKGIVEADETYVLESRKGARGLGRKARRRGGKAKKRGLSREQVPVLMAADRSGTTVSAVLPRVDAAALAAALDPVVAKDALLVSDGGASYPPCAAALGVSHEALNRSMGERVRGDLHVQTVNSRHSRLKDFLRPRRGIATRYLDNYLSWFHLVGLAPGANDRSLPRRHNKMTHTIRELSLILCQNGHQWPGSEEFLDAVLPNVRARLTTATLQWSYAWRSVVLPWRLARGRTHVLAGQLEAQWGICGTMQDTPETPRWMVNATCYETGRNWRFSRRRMGDYVTNYVLKPATPIADAIAASAAVPGAIGPLAIRSDDYDWHRYENGQPVAGSTPAKRYALWDGGVYDNLGVESLFKPGGGFRDGFDFLVVSDASAPLSLDVGRVKRTVMPWRRALRLVDVATEQVRGLRARSLVAEFQRSPAAGVYVRSGNTVEMVYRAVLRRDDQDETRTTIRVRREAAAWNGGRA